MGMYEIAHAGAFAQDGVFWELLAFTAGTGGSILIIGSAAGVAAMGMEKIDFIWYMKKMSILALIGYFAGIGTYWAQEHIIGAEEESEPVKVEVKHEFETIKIPDNIKLHLDSKMFIKIKEHQATPDSIMEEHPEIPDSIIKHAVTTEQDIVKYINMVNEKREKVFDINCSREKTELDATIESSKKEFNINNDEKLGGLKIVSKGEDTQEMNADTTNVDSDTTAVSDETENTEETVE